jgi:hypothetical protein
VTDEATPRYYTFKYVPSTSAETAERPAGIALTATPNPFYAKVSIKLQIADGEMQNNCNLEIYNINGKIIEKVKSAIHNKKSAIEWDASGHTAGLYIIRLTAGHRSYTRHVTLLK